MSHVLDKLSRLLNDARDSATLERFSVAFPHERIEIKKVHFSSEGGEVGEEVHPDEYIKRMVKLHHSTWIIGPLTEAIAIIEANRELIDRVSELAKLLERSDIERIAHLAKGGAK